MKASKTVGFEPAFADHAVDGEQQDLGTGRSYVV